MSDFIWETFDSLFKTVHRQGRRLEDLEARVVDLESRLAERQSSQQPKALQQAPALTEMPAERAA